MIIFSTCFDIFTKLLNHQTLFENHHFNNLRCSRRFRRNANCNTVMQSKSIQIHNKTESKFSPRPGANPFCNLFKSIQLLPSYMLLLPVLSNLIYNQSKTLQNTKMFLLDRKIWSNTFKIYVGHSKTYFSEELIFLQG